MLGRALRGGNATNCRSRCLKPDRLEWARSRAGAALDE